MAIYKELLLLKKPIVWQLDQLETAVIEQEFVWVFYQIERLSLQELRISLAEFIVTPLGLKLVQ